MSTAASYLLVIAAFVTIIGIKAAASVTVCPASFTYIRNVNGCYKFLDSNLDWSQAAAGCRSLHRDAHLIIINDEAEQRAVGNLLQSAVAGRLLSNCIRMGGWGTVMWTAGQRIIPGQNTPFLWRVPGGGSTTCSISEMTYTNWAAGDSPDFWRNEESCMQMFELLENTWNDINCSRRMCSVCELDM